jgi:hypothetical protein
MLPFRMLGAPRCEFSSRIVFFYPLCFDIPAKPSSCISFPLIIMQNTPEVGVPQHSEGENSLISLLFATLTKMSIRRRMLILSDHREPKDLSMLQPNPSLIHGYKFPICHSYENNRGVPQLFPFWNATGHSYPEQTRGTAFFPLHFCRRLVSVLNSL